MKQWTNKIIHKTLHDLICSQCKIGFQHYKKYQKYCSHRCFTEARKQIKRPDVTARFTKSGNPNWKNGRILDKSGYILLLAKEHPNSNTKGYVREHRWVVEQSIGRYLNLEEIVHHINHNKQDNRIENLMVVTKSEHGKLHPPIVHPGRHHL